MGNVKGFSYSASIFGNSHSRFHRWRSYTHRVETPSALLTLPLVSLTAAHLRFQSRFSTLNCPYLTLAFRYCSHLHSNSYALLGTFLPFGAMLTLLFLSMSVWLVAVFLVGSYHLLDL